MTVANIDYEIEWLAVLLVTLYFHDAAWFGHRTSISKVDEEIGYAVILTWLRAASGILLASMLWFFMAELSLTVQIAIGGGIIQLFAFVCFGLFFYNLAVGIVVFLYLVLPSERIPKAFKNLTKPGFEPGPA